MAHSLRTAARETDGVVHVAGSTIAIHASSEGYWQELENAEEKTRYKIDFVVGSGTHASGYLTAIGGHLFQSPIAFYTLRLAYDLAPGYEKSSDPDFTRPVSEECLLCHSGKALHVAGTLNEYASPVFAAAAIGCDRCHGPEERHLSDPRPGNIVNPAKLPPAARDSVCEQCHLFGLARVANPGRQLSDFVPGQPLESTFTIYRNDVPPGSPPGAFKVISHAEQLASSTCARNSAGRLWCGTCHDPHSKPDQPQAYFRARCLSCHNSPLSASHPPRDSDCIACHMPKRNASDGGHTIFTDHRIQARPSVPQELPPDAGIRAWREPPADLQRRNLGIAYIDVGMQRHSSAFVIQGYRMLTEVQQQFAGDSDLFKSIANALLVGRQTSDAKLAIERALALDPNSAATEASAAGPYLQSGDDDSAIHHLERSLSIDPLYLPAASTLIGLYQKHGRAADAESLAERIRSAMDPESASPANLAAAPPVEPERKAEQQFKNIQVLKGLPASQLVPAMEFISSSLGVACSHCHVEGRFEDDQKKPKQTARKMMQMVSALNRNTFAGLPEITCYSCHRGEPEPAATPLAGAPSPSVVLGEDANRDAPDLTLRTSSSILENWIQALGGASALSRVTSLAETGTETRQGQSAAIEILIAAGKRAVIRHESGVESRAVFDGQSGWSSASGATRHKFSAAGLLLARLDSDPQLPLDLGRLYPDLRMEYPELVQGRQALVLAAFQNGSLAAKFYFDQESGLLTRILVFAGSVFGSLPAQVDYADFREVEGMKFPFSITYSYPQNLSVIRLESVRTNAPIDAAKFAKPQ